MVRLTRDEAKLMEQVRKESSITGNFRWVLVKYLHAQPAYYAMPSQSVMSLLIKLEKDRVVDLWTDNNGETFVRARDFDDEFEVYDG